MTKQEIKQNIAEMEDAMKDMSAEEKALIEPSLKRYKQMLKEAEEKEKKEEKSKTEKQGKQSKTEEKKQEKKPAKKQEEKPKTKTEEKKPTVSFEDAELTPSEIKTLKKFFGAIKSPLFKTLKSKTGTKKKTTKVKKHSKSYIHAKRIADNMPKVFRPAIIELSRGKENEQNKKMLEKTEKLVKLFTVFANDIDYMVLTKDENYIDAVNEFLIKVLKETHQNNDSFKYEGRQRIKDIVKTIPELATVKFADGGLITD